MGCGIGACLGCVIPGVEKPFIISCTEGPILPPEKIAWGKL
jgi:dihydroorotate dehydrogenase electron transfer subunit